MAAKAFMFFDERMLDRSHGRRLIISCFVVGQETWRSTSHQARLVQQTRPKRRLRSIQDVLHHTRGFAVVSYSHIPAEVLASNPRDHAEDVPDMARTDNAWSILFAMNAMAVLRRLHDHGIVSAILDLYHDPKTLTSPHRQAFHITLRDTLPRIAYEEGKDKFICCGPTEVSKAGIGTTMNYLQQGTSMAHNLCLLAQDIMACGSYGRIYAQDFSERLLANLALFQISPAAATEPEGKTVPM